MLLSTHFCSDPRIVELGNRDAYLFIRAFSYSSQWNLPTLKPTHLRFCGVNVKAAARFAELGLALLEEDGSLTWACDDLARFAHVTRRGELREGGYTYLIQAGDDGPVKIGSTYKRPDERLRALQTGSSEPLRLLKVLEGAHHERHLHARFAQFRTRGEWFDAQILDWFE